MAKASEQFRQSDVTRWGIVALVLGGIAVLSANLSALLPPSMLAGLHKTRLEGASLEQLRTQFAELREESLRLRRENEVLTSRFTLNEQQGNDVTRRVGALEVSLPRLLEALPDGALIDRSNLTAGITRDPALVYQTDGGSVVVRHQPMAEALPAQPLPAPVTQLAAIPAAGETAFGVALGGPVEAGGATEAWRDLNMKLGPLLFGLSPLLLEEADGTGQRVVVGPIPQLSEASALCARLERVAVACLPVAYAGTPLEL